MSGRVLAVDTGEKRIGIALSDPTGTIATPLIVLPHVQMIEDCQRVAQLAFEHEVGLIIIGQALSADGGTTRQALHAQKFARQLGMICSIPIVLWDESNSTRKARLVRIDSGAKRKKRSGHMDDLAAAVFLQDYLDAKKEQRLG
jgi:putative Holliday junction resolvase